MIKSYKSKPVHVDAMLYQGETTGTFPDWLKVATINRFNGSSIASLVLLTKNGVQTAWAGQDYIIHYDDGSIDVMRKDAFEATFIEDDK